MPNICVKHECEEISKYGKVNEETGFFEKKRCKKHKEKDDKGNAPPWKKRYFNFNKICEKRGYELIISEKEWIIGTTEEGCKFKPPMRCDFP